MNDNKISSGLKSDSTLIEALDLHCQGSLDGAEEKYHSLITNDSNHSAANFMLDVITLAKKLAAQKTKGTAKQPKIKAHKLERGEQNLAEGFQLHQAGDFKAAETKYLAALKNLPDNAEALHLTATLYFQTNQLQKAVKFYQRAVSKEPAAFLSWMNLGITLQSLGRDDEAIDAYRHVLAVKPDHVETLGHLARLKEERNKLDEVQPFIELGLIVEPNEPTINLVAARLERRNGLTTEPRDRLRRVIESGVDETIRSKLYFELGRTLDAARDAPECFEAYTQGNKLAKEWALKRGYDAGQYLEYISSMHAVFSPDWIETWTPAPPSDRPAPVFQVGFPRSGTTLLDQILSGHSALKVIEEQPTVTVLKNAVARLPGGFSNDLPSLSEEEFGSIRKAYFNKLDEYSGPHTGMVVDKLPLNLVEAGLIHRIFPEAKFIFSIRHPHDVCLSCFMQDFSASNSMANFYAIKDAAELYEQVMSLWFHFQEVLPIDCFQLRYEDLVDDTESTVRPLFEFLDLKWEDAVLEHTKTALSRDHLKTPSYHQVSRPIYTSSRYRWHRFENELQPIFSALKPFVEKFGYADIDPKNGA